MSGRMGVFAAALFLLACAVPGAGWLSQSAAQPAPASAVANGGEARRVEAALTLIAQVNLARQREGSDRLEPRVSLVRIAGQRASDMVDQGYFDHVDPVSGTVEAERLMRAQGYTGSLGELLFASTASLQNVPAAAVEGWLGAERNRDTLLDPSYRHVGAAIVDHGSWWYVVLVLAERGP